ncbi:hypothetical protein RhiirC2_794011 [Rhizophagus irregularis]|uniref:Uncharacterized protein n=1 Tax=Rhizophagus irregularis TaxID=588596 RepID=A0A2N1MEC5_9GLOM|nr:hypothetical protein RhiirC2_794011 [Rhizophagus irregularis]
MRDLFRKNFNSTVFKRWEEAGKPTEEDEEILVELPEYSSIRKAKITRMVLTPPLTLDQLVRLLEKDQLEPEKDDDKRTIGRFIPTIMDHPKGKARLHLKEPKDNKLLPHLKMINVVKMPNDVESPKLYIWADEKNWA